MSIDKFHADVLIVSSLLMQMLRQMEISPRRVGIATVDGDEHEVESLYEVLHRIKEHIGEHVLDNDDDSKKAMAQLLAKVSS